LYIFRAQNDAAVVAAAAAAIEKSTGNSVSNAAGSGAAQLLQGGMAGLAGLQNPLQMNQLVCFCRIKLSLNDMIRDSLKGKEKGK
jgi:hypothetical protein